MKIIAKVLIFFLFTGQIVAQDVQFSQLFSDVLYLNPAYAGSKYCTRVVMSYRNQWSGIRFPYSTYSASFDKYSPVLQGGLGFRIMSDKQGGGVFKQTNADLIYSFHTKLARTSSLKFAVQTSLVQKSIDTKNLVFRNMIHPKLGVIYKSTENFDNTNFTSLDFSLGMMIKAKHYFMGIAASHIPHSLTEKHDEYLPIKYMAQMGGFITIDKYDRKRSRFAIEPNIVYIRQQDFDMLYYGLFLDIRRISFGTFCRQNTNLDFDSLVLSLQLNSNKLALSYSYDITLSRFYGQSKGSHEFSLMFIFSCDKKIQPYQTISCPSL